MTSAPTLRLIRAARMIDGLGPRPVDDAAVLVEGSRISRIGRSQDVAAPPGAPVEEYDYPTGTVLPGLVDVHCHFNYLGDGVHTDEVMELSDDVLLMRSLMTARAHLESGVTTARENGSKHDTGFSLREGLRLGLAKGPRLLPCGNPITVTGGHMWQMGGEADGADTARAAVRRLLKRGADWIKVPVTGGDTCGSFPQRPSFSHEELRAICDEAHNFGKLVGAHCLSTLGIVMSLDAGADMIIHGSFQEEDGSFVFQPDVAERIAREEKVLNTTTHVVRAGPWTASEAQDPPGGTPRGKAWPEMEKAKRDFESRVDQVRQLRQMGVRLVPGSDAGWGWYPFGQFTRELECMVLSGFTPIGAIIAATKEASKAIGVSDTVGTLEAGKEADLLIVDGNPADRIGALDQVLAVFQGGNLIR